MRNYYVFETALQVGSIQALEDGINNLNSIFVGRDEKRDSFFCNPTIWQCNTTQGYIYELFGGIVNEELQRLIPILFGSIRNINSIYTNEVEIDADFPNDCNAFAGFEFGHTTIPVNRRVHHTPSYDAFVINCLKYGIINNNVEMRFNLSKLYPNLIFEERAVGEIRNWKNANQGLYDRIFVLLDDIPLHPFTGGIGETEVLRYMNGVASKRINQAHRVTYKLENNKTTVLACNGHYD